MKDRPAFFLDRDGTIIFDFVYLNDPNRVVLIPGAAEAIRRAREAGYLIVVISNQSGVGRGLITLEQLNQIHQKLDKLLEAEGAKIDLYKVCLHKPDDLCDCRKPKPFMINQAAEELGIDLTKSIYIGDMLTDVQTGKNSKCGHTILVLTAKKEVSDVIVEQVSALPKMGQPDLVSKDLNSAVAWVLENPIF